MTAEKEPQSELSSLIAAMLDGTMTAAQEERLGAILVDDPDAQQIYLNCCHVHALLRMELGGRAAETVDCEPIVDRGQWAVDSAKPQAASPTPTLTLTLTPTVTLPRTPVFSHTSWREYVVPCLASAAIMVVLGAWAWMSKISNVATSVHNDRQTVDAKNFATSLSNDVDATQPHRRPAAGRKSLSVGRITGDADCKWRIGDGEWMTRGREASGERKLPVLEHGRDVQSSVKQGANAPRSPVSIAFGDRLTVASGQLEITYDTGARVTLEGPCTFHVERNGGFLAIGHLTGVMEKKTVVASGQWPVDSAKPQAASSTAFVIATPTALVTDLGTEFGVDVDRNKATTINVIRGEVEAARDAKNGVPIRERLKAGQAIYIASLDDLPIRLDLSEQHRSKQPAGATGHSMRLVLSPELRKSLKQVSKARSAQTIVKPIGLVATAYHHVWNKNGKLAAENDRRLAFLVATDDIFGRGVAGAKPRSSFDTAPVQWAVDPKASGERKLPVRETAIKHQQGADAPRSPLTTSHQPLATAFVGLRYDHPVRFDRIKIFFAAQTEEGGCFEKMPRVFILEHPVDTDTTPPENDPTNWRELPAQHFYGNSFQGKRSTDVGPVIEFSLTGASAVDRTGYGWAIGGVPGNGTKKYLSITELRAYTLPKEDDVEEETTR